MSSPRARYVQAQKDLRNAEEAEEFAKKALAGLRSEELSVAKTGVIYARRKVADASRAYAESVKADLVSTSPDFARLVRNSTDAAEAAAAAHRLFRAIRDVYHAASSEKPVGFRNGGAAGLEEGAAAYAKITSRIFRLHGEALTSLKGELEILIRLATDAEGRVQDELEKHAAHAAPEGEEVAS